MAEIHVGRAAFVPGLSDLDHRGPCEVECPACNRLMPPERDPDDGDLHLPLHGAWPLCDGSGRPVA